ncbi:hypothetical protein N8I77_003595 [Diaporthe amygdali]|uniref:LysM domain-containing protein n=1 Tax=Phomopsis amygdali TaxID=1214568 RepID=A0AAD9SKJ4_PHOAM|nr:hypothetical protein N8I77_003595 [Diaporthe amygdali]
MATTLSLVLVALLLAWPGEAFQYLTEATLPVVGLTSGCVSALTSDLACPRQVRTFTWGDFYPVATLEQVCTASCAAALAGYETSVAGACVAETYNLTEHSDAPVSLIPQTLHYYYNRSCITDGSRWCNNVAAQAAGVTNTGAAKRQGVDKCDDCLIKHMQFVAGSPINGGVAFQDEYSSLTSSCSKTGFPLPSSTTPYPQPPIVTTTPATPTCTGATYQIQPGDTCQSVSQAQDVGTAWLLLDNGLQAFCGNFPTSGSLCVQSTCKVYTVQTNDTCASIAEAQGVSAVMLGLWNPVLGTSCRSIGKSIGDSICLSPPGGGSDYTIPTATAQPTAGPSDVPAPVPTNVAVGTNTHCSLFYEVQPDEYCNLILLRYSISLDDFMFLNQGINSNCTNLFAFESYCVRPVGAIDTYPSHSGYVPPVSATNTIPYDSLPKATYTPPAITGLPAILPLANGTRKDCYLFVDGSQLQVEYDLANTLYISTCQALAGGWGVSLEELQNWNPSLNTNSSDCAPQDGFRYCMEAYDASLVTPGTPQPISETELPIRHKWYGADISSSLQDGATPDCLEFAPIAAPMSCAQALLTYGLTIAQFYAWYEGILESPATRVPSLIDIGVVAPSPTTTSQAPTTTAVSPPGPTQPGIVANCNKWHVVVSGDGCWSIANQYGISLETFYLW